ncbi:MAG TPA: sigma-70 region 4 domain-containing protein [Solirubrobacteraceae bacterium]|jgi:hypothetical protein
MSRLEELPPDQRAALSLVLSQGKTYAELARVLGIPERAVHDRAHAALAVLAPSQARQVPAERRAEIGDYLLGQQGGVAERLATRTYLGSDGPARSWAERLAGELAPLASRALPDIPAGPAGHPENNGAGGPPAPAPARAGRTDRTTGAPARQPAGALPSSRLGGALLLGAIVAAIVVAVILLSGGGGGGSHAKSTSASSTSTSTSGNTAAGGSGPKINQRLTLKPTSASSSALALVEILAEGGKRAFYLAAEHLPASKGFYYAIWLYNSPSSFEPLTRSPNVGSNERLAGGALLPTNAGNYHQMLVTRETAAKPGSPGTVVLSGPFSLGG